jgi:BirA family biotin operon repressor/biotin-[acetyl-CoA-carboxylase] ligase
MSAAQGSPFTVLEFDRLDSTSDRAKSLAIDGIASGTIVRAAEQTAGRGRQGRSWTSERGNLFMSLVLRPAVNAATATELGFVAAVAVAECVDAYLAPPARALLKWPNDVLVHGAKLAGILLESQSNDRGQIDWLVIGIGVNIASHPEHAGRATTSLASLGGKLESVEGVFGSLCLCLAETLDLWQAKGFAPIRELWRSRAYGVGETASVAGIEGVLHDIDIDGALLLRAGQQLRRVTAGDVAFATS